MFNFICGKAVEKTETAVVLLNGGIGYEIQVTTDTLFRVTDGQDLQLFTYFHVTDSGIGLFGFLSREEKSMFLKLITISGIGPKLGLTILSGISPGDLALSVVNGDTAALNRVKGVGKKTAERIILELREKVNAESVAAAGTSDLGAGAGGAASEAALALMALGIGRNEASKLVTGVIQPGMTVEDIITLALKRM